MPPTFTYVRVPADDAAPVEELVALSHAPVGDGLPELLAGKFAAKEGRTGSATSSTERDRILGATAEGSTETFCLVHPATTNRCNSKPTPGIRYPGTRNSIVA
jgi:hypothetical protein